MFSVVHGSTTVRDEQDIILEGCLQTCRVLKRLTVIRSRLTLLTREYTSLLREKCVKTSSYQSS